MHFPLESCASPLFLFLIKTISDYTISSVKFVLLYRSFCYKLTVECLAIVNLLQEFTWLDVYLLENYLIKDQKLFF
uniref:Uncharacterized protein n=1 Tax=uncultured marine crenarchaeote HF4000_APKG6B14 TaxID=455594 RepID=B3T8R0_9ARCH|nr:hypothetical protein ALOHA_HF4000APKG6B14ctg1g13 [uncultured marine crenarchaeote HF4000_APKG6B14]